MNTVAALELEDIQSRPDDRGIAIDEVGIAGLRMPIDVVGRDGAVQTTVATVEMAVDLPAGVKGTHMSRFVDVFCGRAKALSAEAAVDVVEALRARLDSDRAVLRMSFPYFVVREAPVTGLAAPVEYEGRLEVTAAETTEVRIGAKTPVTSLCPCSKEISDYGAHNQRGHVELAATCLPNAAVVFEDLIEIAEAAASSPVFTMLKRPDERLVTMRAFDKPAFVEDIARDAAAALQSDPRVTAFFVRVTNLESIHAHDAVATIRGRRR